MIDELLSEGPWWLLLVQGTVCLAVGLAVSYVLRHRPAHAHQVLLTGLLAAVLMPGLYLGARYCGAGVLAPRVISLMPENAMAPLLPTSSLVDEIAYDLTPGTVAEAVPASPSSARPVAWSTVAAAGWLTASLVLLLRLLWRFVLGTRLLHRAAPLEAEPVARTIEEARSRLGIATPVRIRGSEKVRSPVIWCWVREPVLLLQKAATNDPTGMDWAGVFCHELAHWRRRDHLSGLFAEVLLALFPWHPLLWWARGRLLTLSEQACDDWVLATGHRAEDYAQTLLSLAAQRQMAFLPAAMGRKKTMNTRIRRIINDRPGNPRIGKRWTVGAGCAAIVVSVGVALAQEAPAPSQLVEPTAAQTTAAPLPPPQTLATAGDDARFQAKTYPLKYISGQRLQGVAEIVIGGLGKVMVHADKGALPGPLLVRTIPQNHRRLDRLVLLLDVPPDDLLALGTGRNIMEIFKLGHASAVRLRDALRPVFEKSARIDADERTNSLVVTAPEENITRIRVVIEELDAPAAKVGLQPAAPGRIPLPDKLNQENAGTGKQSEAEDARRVQETPATRQRTQRMDAGAEGKTRLEARVYALEHISPERMRAVAEALIGKPGTVALYANGKKAAVVTTIENHYRLESIIRIIDVPEEDPSPAQDKLRVEQAGIITLKYFSARQMQDILRAVLGEAGHAVADEQRRCLNVVTTRASMRRVESIVRALDVPADDRVVTTEVEELRSQMRRLSEQMQQVQDRLEQFAEQNRAGETEKPSDRTQQFKEY